MRHAFLLLAVSSLVFAEPAGTPRSRTQLVTNIDTRGFATATTAALALYVDPTGNDGNACTATGTSACLTIQAAVDKIPFIVAHPVTVDIAAGSYTGFRFYNHTLVPATVAAGAFVAIRGAAQANVTPTTGTATGTLTGVSTVATVGFHVVTDSGQSWTTDNFTSRFLSLTSGTGSGQVCPIASNTATTITVTCAFSPAPIAGTGYAIVSPATIINTATSTPVQSPAGGTGTSTPARGIIFGQLRQPRITIDSFSVTDIEVSGGFTSLNVVDVGKLYFKRIRLAPTGALIGLQENGTTAVRIELSSITSSTGVAVTASDNPGDFTDTFLQQSYISSATTSATATGTVSVGRSANVVIITGSDVLNTTSTGNGILSTSGNGVVQIRSSRVRCSSASTNTAVNVSAVVSTGPNAYRQVDFNESSGPVGDSLETCGTGLKLNGLGITATMLSSAVFLSNTVALSVAGGSRIGFSGGVPTFTTNTTDISVDATTATRADFVALSPNSITSASYLSSVFLLP